MTIVSPSTLLTCPLAKPFWCDGGRTSKILHCNLKEKRTFKNISHLIFYNQITSKIYSRNSYKVKCRELLKFSIKFLFLAILNPVLDKKANTLNLNLFIYRFMDTYIVHKYLCGICGNSNFEGANEKVKFFTG